MLSINTNLSSMLVQYNLMQASLGMNNAIEQMTTGYKLNNAKDNAANFGIVTNLNTKISAYQVAEDNCAMGLDMLSTANSTLDQIYNHLQRLRDLAEQASNGTYGEASLRAINSEANAIVDEIERLYNTAEYNGLKLFEGSNGGGADSVSTAPIQTYSLARTVTVDESKRVSNVTSFTSGETYYITTSDDLVALQDLVNNTIGSTADVTFELANNIDMSGIDFEGIGTSFGVGSGPFCGVFNGNGYTISNLTSSTSLFGSAGDSTITDLNIINTESNSGIVDVSYGSNVIANCYVSGNLSSGGIISRGTFVGYVGDFISDCTVDCEFSGSYAGGIVGNPVCSEDAALTTQIINCTVLGTANLTGIFCNDACGMVLNIESCKYNSYYDEMGIPLYGGTADSSSVIQNNVPIVVATDTPVQTNNIELQIGTSSSGSSQIGVNVMFELSEVDELRMIGLDLTTDYLSNIDEKLLLIAEKQTELGATENRLNSALEEISTQYENLVSSRSTLRDADVAEVSSEYIRQQILQQASATLLSTANQSASIALGLL